MKKQHLFLYFLVLILSGCAVNYVNEGILAGRNRDFVAMRDYCFKATQQANADALAFKCLAEAQLNLGQRQLAEEAYLTYLGRIPGDVEARTALANLYFAMGRYPAAQVHLETILNVQPGNIDVLYLLAESHRLTNNCEAALLGYDKVLQISPGLQAAQFSKDKAEKEICEQTNKQVVNKPKKYKVIKKKKFEAGGAALDESDW